jgi:hypothetical protein
MVANHDVCNGVYSLRLCKAKCTGTASSAIRNVGCTKRTDDFVLARVFVARIVSLGRPIW